LRDFIPTDINTTGTFTTSSANDALDGSEFDPEDLELGEYLIEYVISKTITVNGDGINDYFELKGLEGCEDDYKYGVEIFNRWGDMVFKSDDYQNDWGAFSPDGSAGGAGILPAGTYYYIVSVPNSEFETVNGFIYIGTE